MMSYTFLRSTGKEDIVVPMVRTLELAVVLYVTMLALPFFKLVTLVLFLQF